MNSELISLQNAANYFQGLTVHEYSETDKRKTTKKYYLVHTVGEKKHTFSPFLDYEQLNYFILGLIKSTRVNLLTK